MHKPFRKGLWFSNAPWNPTGYGNQTNVFLPYLAGVCEQLAIFAFYGLQGAELTLSDNVVILPASRALYGEDMIAQHVQNFMPQWAVGLIDLWVYPDEVLRAANLTTYCPVDHDPIPPAVASKLPHVGNIWAMSKFGETQFRKLGYTPHYVPHAIDTSVYQPLDRQQARQAIGVDDDVFFAVTVAANKGYPSRKNLDRLLKAWAMFVKTHPQSILHLHSEPSSAHGGLNLFEVVRFYGIPTHNIRFVDNYQHQTAGYKPPWMNTLYNAADVFVLPSAGEGFGIPVIEAQAAGCPVVVTDFTAQAELGAAGYQIPLDPLDDLLITAQFSEWALPKVSEILKSLEWAHQQRGNEVLRQRACEFAQEYDVKHVFPAYMLPALMDVASRPHPHALAQVEARAM